MVLYLKVKVKSLMEEAKIIRKEKNKLVGYSKFLRRSGETPPNTLESVDSSVNGLTDHNKWVVRPEARATQLAYGFLRGKKYREIEYTSHSLPNLTRVKAMVDKYGTVSFADGKFVYPSSRLEDWFNEK